MPAGSTLVSGELAELLPPPLPPLRSEKISGPELERRCPGLEPLLRSAAAVGLVSQDAGAGGLPGAEPEELELLLVLAAAETRGRRGETGEPRGPPLSSTLSLPGPSRRANAEPNR